MLSGYDATFLLLKVIADKLYLGWVTDLSIDIVSDIAYPRISPGHGYLCCLVLSVSVPYILICIVTNLAERFAMLDFV